MKTINIFIITFLSFISLSAVASMCESHSDNNDEINSNLSIYNTPCEISNTLLMASSEDVCSDLKEKIANHDHD